MYATILVSQFSGESKLRFVSAANDFSKELQLSKQGLVFNIKGDDEEDLLDRLELLGEISGIDFDYTVTEKPTVLDQYVKY